MCVGCALFAMGLSNGNLQPYDRSFLENLWPRYEPDPYTGMTPDFFSSLALIYPCVTGMLAGMSKSQQLKNPSHSIPKGTFWAIVTCTIVYLTVCWLFGATIGNRTLKVDKFVTASVSFPHEMIVRGGVLISCLGLILGCMSTAPNLITAMSTDEVLPFLNFLRPDTTETTTSESRDHEGQQHQQLQEQQEQQHRPVKALWFTAMLVALPTLGGNLDHVSPYATIFYLLMYAGVNASTCISGYVRPPGFRPTFRYFHWSVSFVGFVWCLGLSFCIYGTGTFVSLLAFLLMHAYIKKARRLAKSGIKWGTLGSAVRYNIVSSALNSLARSAATTSPPVPTEVTLSMSEEGVHLQSRKMENLYSDSSVLHGSTESQGEWTQFQQNSDFHAKNWRPQLLTIMDVDHDGTPTKLHLMSLAAQLQQTGKGINVVIAIIDRSQAVKTMSVAPAIDTVSSIANAPMEDASVVSEITGVSGLAQSFTTDKWRDEEERRLGLTRSGIDHHDTIKLIQRSKALLMLQMKREGMDGFAEVSTTDGKFFEAVWSAVIHTGLGPLSPNTILLCLPSFSAFDGDALTAKNIGESDKDEDRKTAVACEQDKTKAEEYMRTINGILNLDKAVILFKAGRDYPKNGSILSKQGTIDIWWIVHDGGLLLLLPFLLSKHSVWAGDNNIDGAKKKKNRRRRVQAKLRLFAVTTTRRENPEKLRDAVVEHLERLRIHAEVTVVDCLAGTNIADYFRDCNSVYAGSGHDSSRKANGSVDNAASLNANLPRKTGLLSSGSLNPVASLRKEGISTHHMTLGEVFACEAHEEQRMSMAGGKKGSLSENVPDQINVDKPSSDHGAAAASMLNNAIRTYSSDANLVVTNLPFIHKNACAQAYFQFVDTACEGIENVMLVRGSGAEVITAYA